MKDYLQLYDEGLPYFADDLQKVLHALEHKQCVSLCSAYKMGDRRFIDYLYHSIAHDDRFDVYYDLENSFTVSALQKVQNKESNRTKVLLLPWYFRMSKEFIKEYLSIMRDKRNTFVSVIVLEPEFLDFPERTFPNTNVPIEVVLIRKPLSVVKTRQLMDARCELAGETLTTAQRKRIYELSGGHIGLTKRLFSLTVQGAKVTKTTALLDPATKADLLNLELQYRTLSQPTCQTIGLLKKDNSCAIPLLRHFITSIRTETTETLSPLYKKLLELFLSKNGGVVSKKEVHTLLGEGNSYSLWAVYKNISRFSKAVAKQYIVKNVSGKGYMLIQLEKDDRLR